VSGLLKEMRHSPKVVYGRRETEEIKESKDKEVSVMRASL